MPAARCTGRTAMRHEDVRRLNGIDNLWFRIRLRFRAAPPRRRPILNLNHLSDHLRDDIGVPEPVRYADWRALKDNSSL